MYAAIRKIKISADSRYPNEPYQKEVDEVVYLKNDEEVKSFYKGNTQSSNPYKYYQLSKPLEFSIEINFKK